MGEKNTDFTLEEAQSRLLEVFRNFEKIQPVALYFTTGNLMFRQQKVTCHKDSFSDYFLKNFPCSSDSPSSLSKKLQNTAQKSETFFLEKKLENLGE